MNKLKWTWDDDEGWSDGDEEDFDDDEPDLGGS